MAGLFALMYGLFSISSCVLDNSKNEWEKEKNRKKAINNNKLTYWGGDNTEYFIYGDIPCKYKYIQEHRVLVGTKGVYKDKILYDYTQKEIDEKEYEIKKKIESAKVDLKEYVPYLPYNVGNLGHHYIAGYEIESEKKYIVYEYYNRYYLQYISDKPKSIYIKDRYVERYSIESEMIDLTENEYKKRIGY